MLETLHADLARDDMTIDELAAAADKYLSQLVPHQSRYKVQATPDTRTIRYYTSRGLLPKPGGTQGGRARYQGSHLLRLILIKKLQAEYQSLKRITQIMKSLSDAAILNQLFPGRRNAAPPAPQPSPPGEPVFIFEETQTIQFGHGAQLSLPKSLLTQADARQNLADQLMQLAARLRDEST